MSISTVELVAGQIDSEPMSFIKLLEPTLYPRPGYRCLLRLIPFCAGITGRVDGGALVAVVLTGGDGGEPGVVGGEVLLVVLGTGSKTCLEGPVLIGLPLFGEAMVPGCVLVPSATLDGPVGNVPVLELATEVPLFGEVLVVVTGCVVVRSGLVAAPGVTLDGVDRVVPMLEPVTDEGEPLFGVIPAVVVKAGC